MAACSPLKLQSLNHISRACNDVEETALWYQRVLGFVKIERPSSLNCEGIWLFNLAVGVGVHLIKREAPEPSGPDDRAIDPKADHLSFQAEALSDVKEKLRAMDIPFVQETVTEAGVRVTQVFFLDPESNMIEICNCDCLPVRPLDGKTPAFLPAASPRPAGIQQELKRKQSSKMLGSGELILRRANSPTSPLPAEFPGEYIIPHQLAHQKPGRWQSSEQAEQRRPSTVQ